MSTKLDLFRDHCRKMAESEHKPDCPMLNWTEPFWTPFMPIWDDDGTCRSMGWVGPKPTTGAFARPVCDGCNDEDDRNLFARLAAEVEDYQQREVDMFGELSPEPVAGEVGL